jgi:hypothetical membrane protein
MKGIPSMPTRRTLLAIGATAPLAFLALSVLAGLARPGYDIVEQTISDLAVGSHGWIQVANFLVLGVGLVAFAITRGPRRGALFAVAGACAIAVAFFPTDLAGAAETSSGAMHDMLSLVMFLALIGAIAMNGGRRAALVTFALLVVFAGFAGDVGDPLHSVAGLVERAFIGVPLVWIAVSAAQQLQAVAPRIRRVEAADAR